MSERDRNRLVVLGSDFGQTLCKSISAAQTQVEGASYKTPYGEVYNGIDRDTGIEVMWRVINADKVDLRNKPDYQNLLETFTRWMQELQRVMKLECKHLLKYFCCERRSERQIILISEMISRGSLCTYLTSFKHPRLSVCQSWFRQILEGLQYLHSRQITHGNLTCDHIFINSNTGELKIGDLCLVKLPGIIDDRVVFHRPIDDIHHFGLVALEVAFAQILSPQKLHRVMQRLYEAPTLDKKRVGKLAKHINDEEYRSLVEACVYADSNVSAKDLLQHKFFSTVRAKDETLRGMVKRHRSKLSAGTRSVQKRLELIVTENSLKSHTQLRSNVINVGVTIIGGTLNSCIKFKYDMNYDTPESVAQEMRDKLSLPEDYIVAIQSQIRRASNRRYCYSCSAGLYDEDGTHTCSRYAADVISRVASEGKAEMATEGTEGKTQRDFTAETKRYEEYRTKHPGNCGRQPSMGNLSPIDTGSAASICTINTVVENLKAIYGTSTSKHPLLPPRVPSSREETLQPEVSYSDVQLTPRGEYEDEMGKEGKRSNGTMKEDIYLQENINATEKKNECVAEGDEGESQVTQTKGAPTI